MSNHHWRMANRNLMETCLQIVAGLRSPASLTDGECENLAFYGAKDESSFDVLRGEGPEAKLAACRCISYLFDDLQGRLDDHLHPGD